MSNFLFSTKLANFPEIFDFNSEYELGHVGEVLFLAVCCQKRLKHGNLSVKHQQFNTVKVISF